MDKKIAGLIGAVAAVTAGGAMAAAPNLNEILSARTFAELLQPIPNASALLSAADAAKSNAGKRDVRLAQYDEPLAKLLAEYGPRSLFARDVVVLGSLSWLSRPDRSIFPDATRVDPAAVATTR